MQTAFSVAVLNQCCVPAPFKACRGAKDVLNCEVLIWAVYVPDSPKPCDSQFNFEKLNCFLTVFL